ncbi:MAG: MarP family serine protease [Oryzihumus sp.]
MIGFLPVVDLVLAVVLVSYAITGYRQGFVISVMSLVGFLTGGAVGMWLLPLLIQNWDAVARVAVLRTGLLVFGVFVLASVGQAIAVNLGSRMRSQVHGDQAHKVDSVLGSVAVLVAVSVLVWFIAGAVRGGAPAPIARAIGESRILRVIDGVVPPQTSRLFAGFRGVLDREGFPRVFEGVGAEPIIPIAPPDDGVAKGRAISEVSGSIVKITGVAEACNRGQEGSGFVYAPQHVVTNAHVVAGVDEPHVRIGGSGRSYVAHIVVLDPKRDLAVLDVPGLPAAPLRTGAALGRGEGAAVAGFPLDGPYRVDAARIRDVLSARGADIYGDPGTVRQVYSLFARVEPGNSGGPLLDPSGKLVGVVFAKSLDDDVTGYALTLAEAKPVFDAGRTATKTVSSGGCAAG